MTRQTSIDVYRQIEAEGLLSKRRFQVYKILATQGAKTQGEVTALLNDRKGSSFTPRFAELERLGVIHSIGEAKCGVTGRNCLVWETTGKLPVDYKPKKKLSYKQLQEQEEELKSIIRSAVMHLSRDDNEHYSNILLSKLHAVEIKYDN